MLVLMSRLSAFISLMSPLISFSSIAIEVSSSELSFFDFYFLSLDFSLASSLAFLWVWYFFESLSLKIIRLFFTQSLGGGEFLFLFENPLFFERILLGDSLPS